MTKIIEILEQRSKTPKDDVKIELKLYNLADGLAKKCRAHLKRTITVLPEFDLHDETHSEKVLENMEMLLGDKTLALSTYELFLLYLSAFFHDCAMALSDWEINTMKLTEGDDNYCQGNFSIKHDLKTPLKFSVANETIVNNKAHLYKKFESDVKEWMFTPQTEVELTEYLSTLLIEYQNYRNGFADRLKAVKNQSEFNELNEIIRADYIRSTHHIRIGTYIKNLETTFGNAFEQDAWGKKLARDLSSICRSHGEEPSFIEKLDTNAQYFGPESANLQFVAILLRLGDIIHFSFDRAPVELRNSRLFKSEYSFQQWAIKNNGVNYSIDNGKISFRAYCQNPEAYFKLHQYIDWIEAEVQIYFRFQRKWRKEYIDNLNDKVERSNINCDEDTFLPKLGLSFSLNQKKIIGLLMGVGLYKDKYACLRELYQNSLDAVRCMLSQNEVDNRSAKGIIEFNIIREEDKTYLCCIDNGIGMTKDIIENYLLRVGNTYYKSADFYRQQAKWGGKFTPVSQFGIGILSCFMIGDKLEITTKFINEDYVSCSIDGPHESFYYKKTSQRDKESIPVSGTIVKVLLNDEEVSRINNKKLNKIGLLLLGLGEDSKVPEHFQNYLSYAKNWRGHLFRRMDQFVKIVPPNIELIIGIEDGSKMAILSKPVLIDLKNEYLEIEPADFDLIDYLYERTPHNIFPSPHRWSDIMKSVETYKLTILFENTEYITTFSLPKKVFAYGWVNGIIDVPKIYSFGVYIDGIYINWDGYVGSRNGFLGDLSEKGMINFFGELRPQLSVDRASVVYCPGGCEKVAKKIVRLLIMKIIDTAKDHITKNSISTNSTLFNLIWKCVFKEIEFAFDIFINEISCTEYGNIVWKNLSDKLDNNQSIRDFMISNYITINDYNFNDADIFTEMLILAKMFSANEVIVQGLNVKIKQNNFVESDFVLRRNKHSSENFLFCVDKWEIFDEHFDIISNLYPLVPKRLFDLLDLCYTPNVNKKIKITSSTKDDISGCFCQDPLFINEKLGLYHGKRIHFHKGECPIYHFKKRHRTKYLFEINSHFFELEQKERYVLLVFINPCKLTAKQSKKLEKYTVKDPSYVKGVREGWSLLVTSMEKENVIVCPGVTTREHLVSLISDDFWETYSDFTFRFTDNTIMERGGA